MPATATSPTPLLTKSGTDHPSAPGLPEFTEQTTLPSRFAHLKVVEAPRLTQVYISLVSGLGVHGILKSVSRDGIQILTPAPVPIRSAVLINIAGCATVRAEVLYCVKRAMAFQVGMVLYARYKPDVVVGDFAVIHELEDPFTEARGHIVDVGTSSLSIVCKTDLSTNSWVRVESSSRVLFGHVERVVASSMMASCVGIHLDSALPAQTKEPTTARRES